MSAGRSTSCTVGRGVDYRLASKGAQRPTKRYSLIPNSFAAVSPSIIRFSRS